MMTHTFFGKKILKCLLQKLQSECAAQLVTCSRKYDHITPPLKDLYWLPVAHCIRFKIQDTFKSLRNLTPSYIQYLLIHHCAVHSFWSSSSQCLSPAN